MHRHWVYSLPVIIFVLLLSSASATDFSDPLEMELMLEDGQNSGVISDLHRFWVSETSDHLVFVVSFHNNTIDLGAAVNITLRDELNNLFLIQAWYSNESYSLSITEAVSLDEPRIPNSNGVDISYITRQVFYDGNHMEFGFFIDYADLSGNQEYDFIAWVGMPGEPDTDRMPNNSFLTFDSVGSTDRQFDLQAAMNGDFDVNFPDPTTSSSSPPDPSTTTDPGSVPPVEEDGPPFLMIFTLLLGSLIFLIWYRRRSPDLFPDESPAKAVKSLDGPAKPAKTPSFLQQRPKPEEPVQMKYMEELGREVRMCCFQTARLNESYCYCGRAVEQDLLDLFESEHD